MIEPLDLNNAYVLEPSAGKGDILDAITKKYDHYRGPKLYAIEINSDLRAILESKEYSVIYDDFLNYTPRLHFTHVIANPPFSNAEDHLLKAWEILYEGEIVCLMNATSLEGKTYKEQLILKMIEDHGSVEHIGQAFKTAERPTNAEIAIVRLTKTANGMKMEWDVKNDREEPTFDDDKGKEVGVTGFIADLLSHFNAALGNYEAYVQERMKIERYSQPFGDVWEGDNRRISILKASDDCKTPQDRYNRFVELMQMAAWDKILEHPNFRAILTERARAMMKDYRLRQRRVDFNEYNIRAMFGELVAKQQEIMDSAILDAFDTMTEYHEENRVYFEGWKSNKAWRVNYKVVLPYYIDYWATFGGSFHLNYHRIESLNDIDRALCIVAKRPYNSIQTVVQALEISFQNHPKWAESHFFEIKYFQKGTLHLRFKDLDLLAQFNAIAAKGRNWLPPDTGAKDAYRAPAEEPQQQSLALTVA